MFRTTRVALFCASALCAAGSALAAAPLVTAEVTDAATVTLANERPVALHAVVDKGALADTHMLSHVTMVLKRSPEMQAAFDKLVADQLNPKSASYHQWLKPADLRAYGPAEADIAKTVSWLQSHGLTVNSVSPSGMSIDFAGSAKQVGEAFHTSLHSVALKGEAHIANMTDPAIPAALAPVVRGATLSNFFPKPNMVRKPAFTVPFGNGDFFAVGPADFATIYATNTLYSGNNAYGAVITGAGITVAVVEQTDIKRADWVSFRKQFKLTRFSKGSLTFTHPGGCGDPGFIADEGEAALDAEWSSAVAPDAEIIEASCPQTETTFGVETTLQSLVELGTTASALSISYGGSEVGSGLTFLAGWSNLVEEGAAEGLSIMISSGDSGSSSTEDGVTTTGLAVNGLSTNPYNTTLGGTDFYDTALGKISTYWKASNNTFLESAKSYIPEIPWNNGCSSAVFTKFEAGGTPMAFCNSANGTNLTQNGVGGSGGQSIYYSKPDWQNIGVPGVPADGVRDQPDVSLFAANGIFSHFYVFCMSDANEGGTACDYTNANDVLGNAAGGTSFAAPAFTGVVALLAQFKGTKLGNIAPRLYQLAQLQYTNPLMLSRCNSTLGNAISTACVFYNVTAGDNSEPCVKGTLNCHTTSASTAGIGILSASTKVPYVNAFPAGPGYSLATGLGTVNVPNLLFNY